MAEADLQPPHAPGATSTLHVISSMATRQLLSSLADAWSARTQHPVNLVSVGGVEAAQRVAAGEAFDLVVLADDALHRLAAQAAIDAHTLSPVVASGMAACVPAGAPRPAWRHGHDVREAVLATVAQGQAIGYSTGPSGGALLQLFERWGLMATLGPHLLQARPGVPVGSLVASGEAGLGFQQLSELIHEPGIALIGPLPDDIQVTTVFSAAVCAQAQQPDAAADFLRFLRSADAADTHRAHGMAPL